MTLATCLIVLAAVGCRDESLTAGDGPQASDNVRVSPSQAAVEIGSSLKLSATFTADDGTVDTAGFSWFTPDASIATIDQSGMVTGVGPGLVSIAAITADRQFSGFADVQVVSAGEGGGGEGGGSGGGGGGGGGGARVSFPIINQSHGGSNEPSGMTPIAFRDWTSIGTSCLNGQTWCAQGWTGRQTGNYRIATDPQRGNVAEAIHPQGHNGGSSGGFRNDFKVADITGANATGYREVYVRYFIKLDPSYRPHGSGVLKTVSTMHGGVNSDHGSFWIRVFGIPQKPCTDPATGNPWPCDPTWSQASMHLDVMMHPGWNTGGVQSAARQLNPNRGNTDIARNRWYEVEYYVKANSQGGDYHGNGNSATACSTDGTVRVWLDGALVLDYTDVCVHTGRLGSNLSPHPLLTDGLELWPGYGGTGGPGLPQSQFVRFDDFYFSGK